MCYWESKTVKNLFYYDTIIGRLKIIDDGKEILEIGVVKEKLACDHLNEYNLYESQLIKIAYLQLSEYFSGKRKIFDLPLKFEGTEFQKKVWKILMDIPYGERKTYKQIAESVGCPKGCRAAGNANNKNKIMIVVPCHRVIGASGDLVGYARTGWT